MSGGAKSRDRSETAASFASIGTPASAQQNSGKLDPLQALFRRLVVGEAEKEKERQPKAAASAKPEEKSSSSTALFTPTHSAPLRKRETLSTAPSLLVVPADDSTTAPVFADSDSDEMSSSTNKKFHLKDVMTPSACVSVPPRAAAAISR